MPTTAMRSSVREPAADDDPGLDWTLALAGGEGARLQGYVMERFGERTPKQYCNLIGSRSLLEDTLDRMNVLTPASRTITVIGTGHGDWARPQLAGRSDHVFCQPSSRDTAVALYVALAMIMRWHPNAIVTIAPTDHYVAPAARFLQAVSAARRVASNHRDLVVLLGVTPSEPDPELGYVVLGPALNAVTDVRTVTSFVEKPTVAGAIELRRGGALWSTMVACGSVSALWELGRAADPQLLDILDSLVPLIGTEDEPEAIDYIYRTRSPVCFSRDICERGPERIAVMQVADVEWSDLGTPERIARVLARHGTSPS